MMAWHIHKAQFGENAPFIAMYGKELDQHWGDLATEFHQPDETNPFHGSGLLEMAEGGTLFIRDINLMSPKAQSKLAFFLESGEINCRIIGSLLAENSELTTPIFPYLEKHFSQHHKFNPLRERKRDITILAKGILERLAKIHNRKIPTMNNEATRLLLTHNYRQGNTSELIKIIERAFFLSEGETIGPEHLFFGPAAERPGGTFDLLSLSWIRQLVGKEIFPLWFQRLFFFWFCYKSDHSSVEPIIRGYIFGPDLILGWVVARYDYFHFPYRKNMVRYLSFFLCNGSKPENLQFESTCPPNYR